MAYEILHGLKSFNAAASFSSPTDKQYTFVNLNSDGEVETSSEGGYAVGVMQEKPGAGEPGQVCGPGSVSQIQCGGDFDPGDDIASDSDGKAVQAVSSGDAILGVAVEAGESGIISTILYQPKGSVA